MWKFPQKCGKKRKFPENCGNFRKNSGKTVKIGEKTEISRKMLKFPEKWSNFPGKWSNFPGKWSNFQKNGQISGKIRKNVKISPENCFFPGKMERYGTKYQKNVEISGKIQKNLT